MLHLKRERADLPIPLQKLCLTATLAYNIRVTCNQAHLILYWTMMDDYSSSTFHSLRPCPAGTSEH
jgi:hypothetical protein